MDKTSLTIPFHFLLPEAGLTILLHASRFPNKPAPKVPNNMLKNPPFYSFVLFSMV